MGIRQRDREIGELRSERDYARGRVDQITREFREYREALRPGLDPGLFRVPALVVDLAKVGGGVVLGTVLGERKPAPRQDQARPVVSELELVP